MFFAPFKLFENNLKGVKMTQMGYSPCFLVKNGQKCMFFVPFKLLENNLKGVKMTQMGYSPCFLVKNGQNACFWHLLN
jgi:hypothetical protein